MGHMSKRDFPIERPPLGLISVINYNWFWLVFNYMTLELKVVSDCRQYYGCKFSQVLSLRSNSKSTVNSLPQNCTLTKNIKAIKISTYTHRYWWVDQNKAEYSSIIRPFALKNRREGKVKQIIIAQTMLPNNYSRDSLIAPTTWRNSVTRFM